MKTNHPEFPFFGAKYPDARCIDGHLYDLDDIDEEGHLLDIGITPCPFCNKKEFIDWYGSDKYNQVVNWVKEHYPDFN